MLKKFGLSGTALGEESKGTMRDDAKWLWLPISLSFIVCVYAPFELYMTNQGEFWFTYGDVVLYSLMLFAISSLILTETMILVNRRSHKVYCFLCLLFAALIVSTYIQGSFLVNDLPATDGRAVDWSGNRTQRLLSIGSFAFPFVIFFILWKKFGSKMLLKVARLTGQLILILLILTMIMLIVTCEGIKEGQSLLVPTEESKFMLSDNQNLVVLGFDTIGGEELMDAFEKDAELSQLFEGFTRYDNVLAAYNYTEYSIPAILSGEPFPGTTDLYSYVSESLDRSPLINGLEERNYRKGLYAYGEYRLDEETFNGRFDNYSKSEEVQVGIKSSIHGAIMVLKMAGIKFAPWDLKRFCIDAQQYAYDIRKIDLGEKKGLVDNDNGVFWNRIKEDNPFEITEEPCFRFIFLIGAHIPYEYDKNMEKTENATRDDSIEACITMCKEYLRKLKSAELYDKTAIVVLSDHGEGGGVGGDEFFNYDNSKKMHSILLVKGIGEKGEMNVSSAPISVFDYAEAFAKLLDGRSGGDIFNFNDGENRERVCYVGNFGNKIIKEYKVRGMPSDVNSYEWTGKELYKATTGYG